MDELPTVSGVGTYAGDSSGKKLARAFLWLSLSKKLDKPNPTVLTLAGEGGDFRTLRGLGIQGNIVGAELDDATFQRFMEKQHKGKWAERVSFHEDEVSKILTDFQAVVKDKTHMHHEICFQEDVRDVAWIMQQCNVRADVVFLDFCSTLLQRNLQAALRTAQRCLSTTGILVLGFMYGREQEKHVVGRAIPLLKKAGYKDAATARSVAAQLLMQQEERKYDLAFKFVKQYAYSSVTEDKKGVPMLYMVWQRVPKPTHRVEVLPYTRLFGSAEELKEQLRETVLDFHENVGFTASQVADIFGLDSRTVAAWKAHKTRGTYDQCNDEAGH